MCVLYTDSPRFIHIHTRFGILTNLYLIWGFSTTPFVSVIIVLDLNFKKYYINPTVNYLQLVRERIGIERGRERTRIPVFHHDWPNRKFDSITL